jgi:adenine-specific DNA-methyltransferase
MKDHFEKAFSCVQSLVSSFQQGKEYFLSPAYQEAEVRKDYIDKFFIALGWDVYHDEQKNPYEQEVKVERSDGTSQRRADYAFRIKPNFRDPRFYVEAKKPYGDIATADNYFQTIRYGWSSQTPIAILTDFEQFQILDCRCKPDIDTVLSRCIHKFKYTDYADRKRFSEIFYLFSRRAVENDAIKKYAALLPKPENRGRQRELFTQSQAIDESFLEELDQFRASLARIFHKNNRELDGEALTEVTQRTLDRLVFIRFLEDKLIEADNIIDRYGESGSVWKDFVASCRRLDDKYNGIVFKKHRVLDDPALEVDDGIFGDICERMNGKTSPYDFNVISIDILGNIYERFLSKVIEVHGHRVEIVEKPETRKSGGVYYTPQYIVRYIVENTVGKLIEGKTPAQTAEMRFGDIACGSGSFLLGVYDLLLRFHTKYYNANPMRVKKGDCIEKDGSLHLSLKKKREIAVANIYGVDIDPQAVEVAQLSIYLKMLEEETTASARGHQFEFDETLLPSLNRNIVCGNSIIGTDILAEDLLMGDEENKLHPMDFDERFRDVMQRGGFDALVGNPPYVRIQTLPANQVTYLTHRYESVKGNCDLYVSFVQRGYELLKQGGRLGQIVPNKFIKTDYGEGLRKFIASKRALAELVNFGHSQVFAASIYTCLLFLTKAASNKFRYAKAEAKAEFPLTAEFKLYRADILKKSAWFLVDADVESVLRKLSTGSKRLLDLPAKMSRGSSSGADTVFVIENRAAKIERSILRTPVFAEDFNRYGFRSSDKWKIIFPYVKENQRYRLYTDKEMEERFPKTYRYLTSKQIKLKDRKQYSKWYGYSAPRNLEQHEHATIAVPLLADRGAFALIPTDFRANFCPMASGGFTVTIDKSCELKPEYVLGVLNSKLLFWNLRHLSNVFRGGWITCTKQYFGEIPIKVLDLTNQACKTQHDRLVKLVQDMSKAKSTINTAKTDRVRSYAEAKCRSLDKAIESMVSEIYGLTNEEIQLVERDLEQP